MKKKINGWHPCTWVVHPHHPELEDFIVSIPERFDRNEGTVIYQGRNELRRIDYNGRSYVVKAFHRPHFINRLVYGIFRPSKAKRSYEHADLLLRIGVGTPEPIGYINVRQGILFDRSYYVSGLSTCPYLYNDLFGGQIPYVEEVCRAVGRMTAVLHEHGYAHKDYGRGNILFEKTDEGIRLEVVDLNRLYIGPLDIKLGCKNFERLPATPDMHRWMAEEYARARGFDADECFRLIAAYRSTQPGKIDGLY